MMRVSICSLLLIFFQSHLIKSSRIGVNELCNTQTQTIVSDDGLDIKFPYRNESERYQVFYEHIKSQEKYVYEVTEYFDGLANIGVADVSESVNEYSFYVYYNQKELITTNKGVCVVEAIGNTIDKTPFSVIIVDGKPHVATALTLLSQNVTQNAIYLGSKNRFVRGIAVREWLVCARSQSGSILFNIVVSYSNPEKWTPALQASGYESIPIKIEVTTIDLQTPATDADEIVDVYNMFDFRPGLYIREEDYYVSKGYYCKNRLTKKPFPITSETYSFVASFGVEYEENLGSYPSFRYEFYSEKNLSYYDYVSQDTNKIVVADYSTHLSWTIDPHRGMCDEVYSEEPFDVFDLFRVNELPPYEYVGRRQVRGMNTDVWAAPRIFNGKENLYEWYFMADGWQSFTFEGLHRQDPVLMMMYEEGQKPVIFNIGYFQRLINPFNFDLRLCRDQYKQKHIMFKISGQNNYEMISKNKMEFKKGTLFAIEKSARVGIIRISQLEVLLENKQVTVVFTLLDKSNATKIIKEIGLDESYQSFMRDVEQQKFVINFEDSKSEKITIEPDWKSFVEMSENKGRYVYSETTIQNGGLGIGETIGVIIGGLLVCVVIGLLVGISFTKFKQRGQETLPPTMISFENPLSSYN